MKNSEEIIAELDVEKRLDMEKYVLVILFLIQQRWSYTINKEFQKDHITTKQWLMLIVISNAFDHDPSMKEVADTMSITHQNVKQVATRLETTGFLKIERDPKNKRILRLKVTEKSNEYWESRAEEHAKSIATYFKDLDDQEITLLFKIMGKLEKISGNLYEEAKNIESPVK
jgi:DNA-binding MarR family transcriptional regulator